MSEELDPCPCCGGDARIEKTRQTEDSLKMGSVCCENCFLVMRQSYDEVKKVVPEYVGGFFTDEQVSRMNDALIFKWNTRCFRRAVHDPYITEAMCKAANIDGNGKCLGYQMGGLEYVPSDEPCDQCKDCEKFTGVE